MNTAHKTDQEMTAEYCLSIANEVAALELLLDGGETNENDEAIELLNTLAEQSGEELNDYSPSVLDYINAYALEFKTLGERDGLGNWEITGYKILRSFGGPNCWIVVDGAILTIETYWGGDKAVEVVYAPNIISQLEDFEN
jgi:hypothetical protein